ncbi:hypothetical protein OG21DRAFT_245089 [Imleria badia]|nr:hypothetical protein OG21DRAFT_245089 [Imleria badia]
MLFFSPQSGTNNYVQRNLSVLRMHETAGERAAAGGDGVDIVTSPKTQGARRNDFGARIKAKSRGQVFQVAVEARGRGCGRRCGH